MVFESGDWLITAAYENSKCQAKKWSDAEALDIYLCRHLSNVLFPASYALALAVLRKSLTTNTPPFPGSHRPLLPASHSGLQPSLQAVHISIPLTADYTPEIAMASVSSVIDKTCMSMSKKSAILVPRDAFANEDHPHPTASIFIILSAKAYSCVGFGLVRQLRK